MRQKLAEKVRQFVALRAHHRCEYCLVHQDDMFVSYAVDHIIAIKHGGGNETSNLAYTCPYCNQYKGSDFTTFLDSYDDIVVLFNPRKHDWDEHFEAVDSEIVPLTRIGQASVKIFRFNEPDLLILRQILTQVGRYPG